MVKNKHAPDELSQQTVTDSRFARPDHQSFFGKWWFATPNRESFAFWGSKPPKLLRPVVAWQAETAQLWWSGVQDRVNLVVWAQDRVFGRSACPNHHRPYRLRRSAMANHQSSLVAAPNNENAKHCSRSCHPNHHRPFGLRRSDMANHHNSLVAAPNN